MPHKLNHLLFTFAFWLMALTGFAQTFPVVINSQISQPTPIYWSNYADATTSNSPIKMQIVLNDLTISNRQVRIKCYWQGNGISFMNNDFVVGAQPLYLEGGVPLQLTNVNLAPYFEFQNMVGITPNQYAQAIPEGIYNFSVEVYDVASGQKLSRKSTITAVIFQNEAPLLNLPLNNASIMQQNIQNIVFSWTPRQINVSNVEYQFDLVEIWDQYTPVQNAFAYSPPIYTTTTRATTLQYSIAEPQLIPGKRYAWRIKAKALAGAEEIGVFKNNGFSEIFAFTYEVFCTPPIQIATDGVSQDQAKVTWSGALDNFDYQVKYREKNADSQWYTAVTPREFAKLVNLKPNTTYEYTVGAACDKGKYVHSSPQEFTTLAKDEIAFAGCGIKPDPKDLTNQNPLPNLLPDDVVTAGDFPIVVIKSSGSNGRFTGEGYVTLPFLEKFRKLIDAADALGGEKVNIGQFSRIRITFNNIGVNTDFKLISGEIIASYDPNWKGMGNLDGIVKDVFGDAGEVVNYDIQFEIASVVKNPDGTITVTGANGASFVQEKTPNDIIFTDKKGKQFTVAANAPAGPIKSSGEVAPGGIPTPKNTNGMGSGGVVAEITSADVSVVFSKGDGKYAFNTAPTTQNGKLNKTYTSLPQKSGGTYNVPFKAISNSPYEKDVIVATADFKNGKTKKDLVFKTQNGTAIDSAQIVWNGNVATLTLKKTLDFVKETVIATVRPKEAAANTTAPSGTGGSKYDIAGTFDLWHLSNKKVNVTLVSVNGATLPNNAEKQLNEIYEPAGVSFTATTKKITLNNFWGNTIETGDSDLLNTYTNEQQDITKALIAALGAEYNANTYYMLYTNEKASNGDDGFMPLKRQFGFVFNGTNRTLAHELGHGVFGLQHAFKQYDTPKGSTDLLMDYGTGEVLNHNDWEIMHAPGLQLYQYTQGSSAGALAGGYALAPDWSFVSNGDETKVANIDAAPEGFLGGFVDSNKVAYKWNGKNYVNAEGVPNTTAIVKEPAIGSKFYLFYNNNASCGNSNFLRTTYTEELQAILTAKVKDVTKLVAYIKRFSQDETLKIKAKDENRTTYWGTVVCNGVKNQTINCPDLPNDIKKITVDYLVNNFYASKSSLCLEKITLEKRKELLQTMLKNWAVTSCVESESYPNIRIGNCYEPITYKLILSTPANDEKALLDWLVQEKIIYPLLDKTQFQTFDDIAKKLVSWQLKYYPISNEKAVTSVLENKIKRIEYRDNLVSGSIVSDSFILKRDGYGQCKECIPVSEQIIEIKNPLDYVLVRFNDQTMGYKAGSIAKMPALAALYLFNKDRRELLISSSKTMFDIGLFAVGVGELQAAYKTYQAYRTLYASYIGIKALGDVGMSITDIIINDALAKEWATTPEGQERLKRWNEINTYYAIATISATAVDIAVQKFGRRVINNTDEFDRFADDLMGVNGAGKFIATSGNDLKAHLKAIINKPLGKSYNSDLVRSLSKSSELNLGAMPKDMTDHLIYSSWGRYDLDGAENAMYLSKNIIGNKTEITHYGNWEDYNTYNFSNVEITNLLDLTDDAVRKQLKVDFNQLVKTTGDKKEIYEFTNVLASWAREKGYNGLIVPGARGLKDYDNIVLFDQAYIKNILKGKIPKLLNKTSGQWNVRSLDKIIEEYPLLKSQWEKLPTNELKAMFQKDFENATESILKQLNKDNSIIFKGWLKFRLKHPTKIICIQ